MDVIISHNHQPEHKRPWSWQAAPSWPSDAQPLSAPRSRAGFASIEEAEADATREGHVVTEVRE